jgi:hypothetical protein
VPNSPEPQFLPAIATTALAVRLDDQEEHDRGAGTPELEVADHRRRRPDAQQPGIWLSRIGVRTMKAALKAAGSEPSPPMMTRTGLEGAVDVEGGPPRAQQETPHGATPMKSELTAKPRAVLSGESRCLGGDIHVADRIHERPIWPRTVLATRVATTTKPRSEIAIGRRVDCQPKTPACRPRPILTGCIGQPLHARTANRGKLQASVATAR